MFKVSFFDSYSLYPCPSFIKEGRYLYAIATHFDLRKSDSEAPAWKEKDSKIFLSTLELQAPATEKDFLSVMLSLREKLPLNSEIKTYFTTQKNLSLFSLNEKQVLFIPPEVAPSDLRIAENFFETHLKQKWTLKQWEEPELPFFTEDLSAHKNFLEKHKASASINYRLDAAQIASHWQELQKKKKMLVHICCGPDAAGVIRQLKKDYELLCFWYDPNIQPKEEYNKRLQAFVEVAEKEQVPYIVGEYDVQNFLKKIEGLEASPEQGAKCSQCYDMRLERSALEAQKQNCHFYTTTLAISPHKVQKKLENFGKVYALKYKVPYYAKNFMKADGFKESVELTYEWNIYRQDYCGCWFSLHEGGPQARKWAEKWGLKKDQIESGHYQLQE